MCEDAQGNAGIFTPFRRRVKSHFPGGQIFAPVIKDPSLLRINFGGHQGHGLPGPIADGFEHNHGELDALLNEWLNYDSIPKRALQQMVGVANSLRDPFYDAYTDRRSACKGRGGLVSVRNSKEMRRGREGGKKRRKEKKKRTVRV